MALSTRPFWLPRAGATGRGSKQTPWPAHADLHQPGLRPSPTRERTLLAAEDATAAATSLGDPAASVDPVALPLARSWAACTEPRAHERGPSRAASRTRTLMGWVLARGLPLDLGIHVRRGGGDCSTSRRCGNAHWRPSLPSSQAWCLLVGRLSDRPRAAACTRASPDAPRERPVPRAGRNVHHAIRRRKDATLPAQRALTRLVVEGPERPSSGCW